MTKILVYLEGSIEPDYELNTPTEPEKKNLISLRDKLYSDYKVFKVLSVDQRYREGDCVYNLEHVKVIVEEII